MRSGRNETMKQTIFLLLILSTAVFAQSVPRYEAEMLKNPTKGGKDTRQVNAVLVFEKEVLKITSRRKTEIFKEFKYSDIKYVEHSFSRTPLPSSVTRSRILSVIFADPFLFPRQEEHWLTILTENDFAVLKIENDNYRLLRMEFSIRDFHVINVNEDR
jgi:hypothetical protein